MGCGGAGFAPALCLLDVVLRLRHRQHALDQKPAAPTTLLTSTMSTEPKIMPKEVPKFNQPSSDIDPATGMLKKSLMVKKNFVLKWYEVVWEVIKKLIKIK